ncbi:MAG: hypothetical protein P8J13_05270 [Gammaproteobacteria bacterium]|nr:hypothetical protein [Gammaproteobacteria bacterium]
MINMPRDFVTSTVPTTSNSTNKAVRFQVIAEEEQPPILAEERRRTPSSRMPATQDGKQQIERHVSFDHRRTTFSSKA